jgi:hypothetical protein
MTSKLKQSIAVQRQIPEHIRENYPVFVEFIKLYYDYLQQTQAQDLEGIRDVDTTLEEFIDNFKSELSTNLPVDMSQDKRFLIKHLKEFYLSRGSESSFKFLFRTLFSKEAELFYPSTEILRVSDGRWKQDISIFVEVSGNTTTLFPLNGNFITITTPRKTITTYVENVTEYTTTTFEIFIQRDYANEIEVGSTVSFVSEGITYTGTILQCPSKISIYKAGSGFSVGDLYSLKTSIGRGCVVKITKTGSLGEIKAVQVVSFGLAYKSKFYSYLSNKEIGAYEYVHPAQINHTYVPGEAAYNERSGGFIDYGFASKQTYFYYDETIPVATPDFASDRYFADPGYVGDIVQQFYADQSMEVIDDSLAIIEISLGAVAKYPGYYMTANGFISDEMFIHDGKYYQAFSYVVKVEEELRKYADILKALIHPAGMRVYSEYNIFKELKVSFVQKSISKLLQFTDTSILGDTGYNYSSYIASFNDMFEDVVIDGVTYQMPIVTYEKADTASEVYSRQNKAALFSTKFIALAITEFETIRKLVDKRLIEDVAYLEAQSKFVNKPIIDETGLTLDTGYNFDAYTLSLNAGVVTVVPSGNKVYSNVGQSAQAIVKKVLENIVNTEIINKLTEKPIIDQTGVLIDVPVKLVEKPIIDLVDTPLSAIDNKFVEKLLIELLQIENEKYDNSISKPITELMDVLLDSPVKTVIKNLVELMDLTEGILYSVQKNMVEDISVSNDVIVKRVDKKINEVIASVLDLALFVNFKNFDEVINNITDSITIDRVKLIEELITVLDKLSNNPNKIFDDLTVSAVETKFLYEPIKNPSDSINTITNGKINLSPYDSEFYFELFSDYQPSTTIS